MKRLPEVRLVIAGAQPEETLADLSRMALPNVTVLGEVQGDSLDQHYRSCSAVVIPYTAYFEERGGTSAVLAEALRWGSPIIAARHLQWCFNGPAPEGVVWASSAAPRDLEAAMREFLAHQDALTPKLRKKDRATWENGTPMKATSRPCSSRGPFVPQAIVRIPG